MDFELSNKVEWMDSLSSKLYQLKLIISFCDRPEKEQLLELISEIENIEITL